MKNPDKTQHWYQEPYVWMVITFPLSAVVAGIVTTYLAIVSYDGLVVDDYYKRGLEINKRIDREQYAAKHGLTLSAVVFKDAFIVDFPQTHQIDMPQKLTATVSHATKPGMDREFLLTKKSSVQYSVAPIHLPTGRWYIDIGTEKWRVTTSLIVR